MMSQTLQPPVTTKPIHRARGTGSLWQRITQGVCRLYARDDWSEFSGTDWAERIMQSEVTDDFHAKQGRSTGRWLLEVGDRQLAVYLKRHYDLPWWQGWGAAFWPAGNWSPGMQECRNLEWAHAHGLPVPKIVAAGEFLGPYGKLQSFLAIEELTGMLALHQAIPLAARQLDPQTFRVWKAGLTREIARLARFLHDRNAFHKDLYLCHFYIARADTNCVPTWTNRVFMIDFHRFARHPYTKNVWITKDLGQLLFSSDVEGIDARDRLRFWRAYARDRRHTWLGKLCRQIVLMRWKRYREHNAKSGSK